MKLYDDKNEKQNHSHAKSRLCSVKFMPFYFAEMMMRVSDGNKIAEFIAKLKIASLLMYKVSPSRRCWVVVVFILFHERYTAVF